MEFQSLPYSERVKIVAEEIKDIDTHTLVRYMMALFGTEDMELYLMAIKKAKATNSI